MPLKRRTVPRISTGTVTFLFTDIEGSTRLWEQFPAAMGPALARHDALLRAAIADHDGYVFATGGDAFCAAFHTAEAGLAAARDAQLALVRETWPAPLCIKVRMALHTGAAEFRDNDYFGAALNRVARLLAAAHGGQVLLSLATQELVRDALPDRVTLRDMGQRRLKDLIRPERVYQLVAPDLPADFPPLKTLDARAHNLPIQLTSFVGRDREMQEVKTLLRDARLVTLTGAGGSGKTRLSLQVAADLVDGFGDGVWLVELAPLTEAGVVAQAVASVLGIKEQPGRSVTETLVGHLRDRELLVLLDNCEHLVEACAQLCETLLAACAKLRFLATSREALRVSGERSYRVPSLATPDTRAEATVETLTPYAAVQLFIDRAVAVKPEFRVDNRNAPAVASICHHLDGIPLAIELAAARLRSMAVDEVNRRLDQRFRLLTGGARASLPRQQTLRSAIDWSYDLLGATEQVLLCRLSVFAGGWTLEAAETICGGAGLGNDDAADLQTSLYDKSLVVAEQREGSMRYRLLETVRQYAREKLERQGDGEAPRRRHRDYYLELAERAEPKLRDSSEQARWLQRLEEEHDNLRMSLEWSLRDADPAPALRICVALSRYWIVRGYLSEGRESCSRALERPGAEARTRYRALALNAAGDLAYGQADLGAASAWHEAGLAIHKELGDRWGVAASLNGLGGVATLRGDLAQARALFEECLAIARELGDRGRVAVALHNLACAAHSQGDRPSARAFFGETLAVARDRGDKNVIARTLRGLAALANEDGDNAAARAMADESLALSRELGDRWTVMIDLEVLADVDYDEGEYGAARALYEEGLGVARELGDRRYVAILLENLASAIGVSGDALRAARIWGAAERLREEVGLPLLPSTKPDYDRKVHTARGGFNDDAAFGRAWVEGRALTVEAAIDLATGAALPPRRGRRAEAR